MRQSAAAFDRSSVEFGRSVSFFDAIYGFALTLLITNIDLPPAQSWSSLSALLDSSPRNPNRFLIALPHATVPAVFFASIPVILLAGPGPGRLVWASLVVLGPVTGRIQDNASSRPGT